VRDVTLYAVTLRVSSRDGCELERARVASQIVELRDDDRPRWPAKHTKTAAHPHMAMHAAYASPQVAKELIMIVHMNVE
jgi:hypothetical protein